MLGATLETLATRPHHPGASSLWEGVLCEQENLRKKTECLRARTWEDVASLFRKNLLRLERVEGGFLGEWHRDLEKVLKRFLCGSSTSLGSGLFLLRGGGTLRGGGVR